MEYLIPQEYTQTLSVLTSRAPQKPYEEIQSVVETDLEKPVEILLIFNFIIFFLDQRNILGIQRNANWGRKSSAGASR